MEKGDSYIEVRAGGLHLWVSRTVLDISIGYRKEKTIVMVLWGYWTPNLNWRKMSKWFQCYLRPFYSKTDTLTTLKPTQEDFNFKIMMTTILSNCKVSTFIHTLTCPHATKMKGTNRITLAYNSVIACCAQCNFISITSYQHSWHSEVDESAVLSRQVSEHDMDYRFTLQTSLWQFTD